MMRSCWTFLICVSRSNLCFERITLALVWRIDSREPGIDAGGPRKGNCNSTDKRQRWLKIGRWHLAAVKSGYIHGAFEGRLNITSNRSNVNCDK